MTVDRARVLGVIPARGGSKGLPGKNLRELGGRPLIAWTIDAALRARSLSRVIVSTDDEAIASAAQSRGCEVPFERPAHLATDEATSIDVLRHALESMDATFDYAVLLQPTSPFRTTEDIDACVTACTRDGFPACVSVTEAAKPPHWMFTRSDEGRLVPVLPGGLKTRRQDYATVYALNGAIFVVEVAWFSAHGALVHGDAYAYPMPEERSLDIDTAYDLKLANLILSEDIDGQSNRIHDQNQVRRA